jgi:hypothetical protein
VLSCCLLYMIRSVSDGQRYLMMALASSKLLLTPNIQ